jgi:hypothetical protein
MFQVMMRTVEGLRARISHTPCGLRCSFGEADTASRGESVSGHTVEPRDAGDRAGRNRHAVEFHVLGDVADDHGRGREQPQRFVQDLLHPHEPRDVAGGHRAAPDHLVDFAQHASFPFRTVRQKIERPGQREGGRVVAGHKERDDIVDKQVVRHAAPGLGIGCPHHPGEEVFALCRICAARLHELGDGFAQPRFMRPHRLSARSRQPMRQAEQGIHHPPVRRVVIGRMSLLYRVEHVGRASRQHRVGNDVEGGPHHVGVNRMDGAGRGCPPARNRGLGRLGTDRPVAQQFVVAEQGGGGAALPAPFRPFARDHRAAEHRPEDLDLQRALRERVGTLEQQGFHCLGAGEEGHARRPRGDDYGFAIGLFRYDFQVVVEQLDEIR